MLQKAGYKKYEIGKVLWALDKATTDGDTARGRRLFYAIFKRYRTPERVVAELLENAEKRRRAQREESAELIRLEAMSHCVPVVATAVGGIPDPLAAIPPSLVLTVDLAGLATLAWVAVIVGVAVWFIAERTGRNHDLGRALRG